MHEQGNRRKPVILFVKAPGERFRAANLGDKCLQGIEHQSSPIPVSGEAYRMLRRQTHPVISAKEKTSPISLRPVIGPAHVADKGLALLPRRETDFIVPPFDEGPAMAIGVRAAAGKMPKPNGTPGENRRRGHRRCPERRADGAGDSRALRIFRGGGGKRRAGRPISGVTGAREAQTCGYGEEPGACPKTLAPRPRCFLGSVHLIKNLMRRGHCRASCPLPERVMVLKPPGGC